MTINREKYKFYKKELTFNGLRFSSQGISATEDRCKVLKAASATTNVKYLRCFLCSIHFNSRFMKDVFTIAESLWKLTRSCVTWQWGNVEQNAFVTLKEAISTKCMAFFNNDRNTNVIVDISPVGLGAFPSQHNPLCKNERHIVCFASRLLSDVERRYS